MNTHEILRFLTELSEHNHKTWFDANRDRYQAIKDDFSDFAEQLIARVGEFDPRCQGLTLAQCTYRINRDTRFSNDKRPYKTHLGVYICPQGKKSGYSGYYFHIEPTGQDYLQSHLLAVGNYCYSKEDLQSIREEIYDNPLVFQENLAKAHGFTLDNTDCLKKAPKGFPADWAYANLLKHKAYCLLKPMTDNQLHSANLLDRVTDDFARCYPFNEQLNRAIDYAREELLSR